MMDEALAKFLAWVGTDADVEINRVPGCPWTVEVRRPVDRDGQRVMDRYEASDHSLTVAMWSILNEAKRELPPTRPPAAADEQVVPDDRQVG